MDCLAITQLIEDDRPTSDAIGQVYTLTVTDPFAGTVVITHTVVAADIVPEDAETSIAQAIAETIANIYAALYAAYQTAVATLQCAPGFEVFLGADPCTPSPCALGIRSTYPGIPLTYETDVVNTEFTLADFTGTNQTANVCNSEIGGSQEICLSEDTLVCAIGSYVMERPNIYLVQLALTEATPTPVNTLYRIDGTSIPAVPVTVFSGSAYVPAALAAGFNSAIAALGADPSTAFAYPSANGISLYLTQDFIDTYSVDLNALTLEECALDGTTCATSLTAVIATSTVPYVAAYTGVSVSGRVCDAWMPILQQAAENALIKEAQGCTDFPCLTQSSAILARMQAVRVLLGSGDYDLAADVLAKAKVDFLPINPCAPVGRCR